MEPTTTPQEIAAQDALLVLRQIECIAAAIRHTLGHDPAAQDAIGGLETLCELSADKLEAVFFPPATEVRS